MRAMLLATALAVGCSTDTTLSEDTAFRRIVDQYASYEECINDSQFIDCYQTLTLCANGRVAMSLNLQVEDGSYQLDGDLAIATFLTKTVEFDLETASSPQLPGRNRWERVEPTYYDCNSSE
ncbi:MAG: hypothetical protein AB7P03_01960 [Kofleriaceae bacterium]